VLVPVGSGVDPAAYLGTVTTAVITTAANASAATASAASAADAASTAVAAASAAQQAVGGVRVSPHDTTPGTLSAKLGVSGLAAKAIANPGADEVLTLSVPAAGTDKAIAGTATDCAMTPADTRAAIAAQASPGASFRNLLIGASALTNPWRRGTGVTVVGGATVSTALSPGATNFSSGITRISTDYSVLSGVTVSSIGFYSSASGTFKIRIYLDNGSNSFTAYYTQTVTHSGGGAYQDFALTTPPTIPGSGTYRIGVYNGSGSTTATGSGSSVYYSGDASGTASFTSDSNPILTRYTYRILPAGYTADRWLAWGSAMGAAITVSKQASGVASSPYCFRVQRTAGDTTTGTINFGQIIEGVNLIPWRGQNLTLRLPYRKGADFSGSTITAALVTGTTADEGSAALIAGTWAGIATTSVTLTPTTSWQADLSLTLTVPATAAEAAVRLSWTASGTAGAGDYVEFGDIELDATGAGAFEVVPADVVLSRCERYFRVRSTAQTLADLAYQMRATPTQSGSGPYSYSAEL